VHTPNDTRMADAYAAQVPKGSMYRGRPRRASMAGCCDICCESESLCARVRVRTYACGEDGGNRGKGIDDEMMGEGRR
jgi:hypothetical protein